MSFSNKKFNDDNVAPVLTALLASTGLNASEIATIQGDIGSDGLSGSITDLEGAAEARDTLLGQLQSRLSTKNKAMSGDLAFNVVEALDTDLAVQNVGTHQTMEVTVTGVVESDGNNGAGDIDVTVTAEGMENSPKTVTVTLANDDDADAIATAIKSALDIDADIGHGATGFFTVTRTDAVLTFTTNLEAANDATMNFEAVTDTAVFVEGSELDVTSSIETEGVAPYVRDVTVQLVDSEDNIHSWFSGTVPVTIAETTAGDGEASLEDELSTNPVMVSGVMVVPITLRGTWAAADTNTLSVTEKTILGYTVVAKTNVETTTEEV